jgi:hypothetical protein
MEWIDLARDRDKWRGVLNGLSVSINGGGIFRLAEKLLAYQKGLVNGVGCSMP